MAYIGTHSGGGHATRNIIIALLVAGVAAMLIAVFAFGAFGIRDSYSDGGSGGIYGGGGAPQSGGGGADSGGGGGTTPPYAPANWRLGYDLLTFV